MIKTIKFCFAFHTTLLFFTAFATGEGQNICLENGMSPRESLSTLYGIENFAGLHLRLSSRFYFCFVAVLEG